MKIRVTGLGPGRGACLTPQALEAIQESEVIVGYTRYVELIRHLCQGKEIVTTGMTREVERCRLALKAALAGKNVAFVCSGDPGVYGMAGVMLEVAEGSSEVDIEVIPGVTAACSSAAILGAPLTHDFAVISLSDRLTPWETIVKRLVLAAEADLVICLYNPRSNTRADHLDRAIERLLTVLPKDRLCGFVNNAGREGESSEICALADLSAKKIDMFTTIIIGNSLTKVINDRMVTPRGYRGL